MQKVCSHSSIEEENIMSKIDFNAGPEFHKALDNNDPLGHFRKRFYIEEDQIYFCGNSLGLLSKDAEESLLNVLDTWKCEGIKIWSVEASKYYLYSSHLAELLAPIVGVDADEIAVSCSTTVNIHQAISTFYKPTQTRYKILVDNINFPTDRYAVDSQVKLKGYDPKDAVKIVKCREDNLLNEDDVIEAMTEDVALVLLPTVFYRSAQICDMEKISTAAKERGIIIGWDLSHAVGAIPVNLKKLDVDFAVWCTYKYLNGGPGSASGLYINRKHFEKSPGLAGWYGNKREKQFLLLQEFEHQRDAGGWQIGTPCILSMAAMEGALKLIGQATVEAMRKKSLQITSYLMFLIDEKLSKYGFKIGNSRDDNKRGGHVCLTHPEAYRISIAMRKAGVIPDYRDPDVIRLTPTALYTSYEEVYKAVEIILDIVKNEKHKEISLKRNYVV